MLLLTTVRTNLYFGSNDLETEKPRETAWDKQKRDIFIYGEIAPKTRDSLEAIIKPRASIIRNFLDTDTEMFVDSAKLFEYEKFTYPPTVLTNLEARVNLPSLMLLFLLSLRLLLTHLVVYRV